MLAIPNHLHPTPENLQLRIIPYTSMIEMDVHTLVLASNNHRPARQWLFQASSGRESPCNPIETSDLLKADSIRLRPSLVSSRRSSSETLIQVGVTSSFFLAAHNTLHVYDVQCSLNTAFN
jgi:hypothetical protein